MQTPSVCFGVTDKSSVAILSCMRAFEDGMLWPTYKSTCPGKRTLVHRLTPGWPTEEGGGQVKRPGRR